MLALLLGTASLLTAGAPAATIRPALPDRATTPVALRVHATRWSARRQDGRSEWRILPSGTADGMARELDAISCLSARFCMTAGEQSDPVESPLVERWDGHGFSAGALAPSGPATADASRLTGVSCLSESFCVAVGRGFHKGPSPDSSGAFQLIYMWNGSAWLSANASVDVRTSALNGVSCVSEGFCVAVGTATRGRLAGGNREPLVEVWNGAAWSQAEAPNPRPFAENWLNGVSCVSASFCAAAGRAGGEGLIESWNGSEWSVVPTAQRAEAANSLNGVSCTSSRRCIAVGSAGGALIDAWNGTQWSIAASPSPAESALEGVACLPRGRCVAAGAQTSAGNTRTLLLSTRGGTWATAPSADGSAGESRLDGVSCIAGGLCAAVGEDQASAVGAPGTLVEYGDI